MEREEGAEWFLLEFKLLPGTLLVCDAGIARSGNE
jgi:hypothetical protein